MKRNFVMHVNIKHMPYLHKHGIAMLLLALAQLFWPSEKGVNSRATCHADYWCGLLEKAVNKRTSHTALRSGDKTA